MVEQKEDDTSLHPVKGHGRLESLRGVFLTLPNRQIALLPVGKMDE